MSERKTADFLASLPNRIRDWRDTFSAEYQQWRADLSKDWTLIYRNSIGAAVFVILGVLVGVILLRGLFSLIPSVSSTGRGDAEPQYAILHVACSGASCRAAYDIRRPLEFREWPLQCEQCKQRMVYRAKLCRDCRHWFAMSPETFECPHCAAARRPPANAPDIPARPIDPDDLDDR